MHTGIDLGLKVTAIVSINDKGKVTHVSHFGADINSNLKKKNKIPPTVRWQTYYEYFHTYFASLKGGGAIGTLIIEEPMNLQGNAIKLVELKALAILAASYFTTPDKVFFPKPTQIKKSFIGSGASTKEQIIRRCKELGFYPKNDHQADAYAAAYMSINGDIKLIKWS